MKGRTYALLTVAGAAAAAWATNRLTALLCDMPPATTAAYPDDVIVTYLTTPVWDQRGELFALIAGGAVLLLSLTNFTGREERALAREVRGKEFGGARWATPEEVSAFGHTAARRLVPPRSWPKSRGPLLARVRERLALFARHPVSTVKASLGMSAYIDSPKPEWCEQLSDDNIILSRTARLQHSRIENPLYERNKHVLVLGGSGSGKTFNFIQAQLLQLYGSVIVTDPKGDLVRKYARFHLAHGYRLVVVDLKVSEMVNSMHYNPIVYITNATSILVLASVLVENTEGEKGTISGNGDYFVKAEKQLYYSLLGFIHWYWAGYPQWQTFAVLIELLQLAKEGTDKTGANSVLDRIILGRSDGKKGAAPSFREWLIKMYGSEDEARRHDEWFVITQYRGFKSTAKSPETEASIISSCNVRLAPFSAGEIARFFSSDELHLERFGEEKTAVYLVMSDMDNTTNFILAMLLYQLFDINTEKADKNPGSHCKIPITCLLDELANIGKIPDLDVKIATLRSRWINLCPVLQSLDQLNKWYKDSAKTIIGNCDTTVFLGRTDEETNKQISERCGKRTIPVKSESVTKGSHGSTTTQVSYQAQELLRAEDIGHNPDVFAPDDCVVFINNARPIKDKKYPASEHPRYGELAKCGELDLDQYGRSLDRMRSAEATGSLEAASTLGATTITDRVRYKGLEPGRAYSCRVQLWHTDPEGAGSRTLAGPDGRPAETTVELVPGAADGEVAVEVSVAPLALPGRTIVSTETISDAATGDAWATCGPGPSERGLRLPGIARRELAETSVPARLSVASGGTEIVCSVPQEGLSASRVHLADVRVELRARWRPSRDPRRVLRTRAAFSAGERPLELRFGELDPSELDGSEASVVAKLACGGSYLEHGPEGPVVVDVVELVNLTPGSSYVLTTEVLGLEGPLARSERVIADASVPAPQVTIRVPLGALPAEGAAPRTRQTLDLDLVPDHARTSLDIDARELSCHVPWGWGGRDVAGEGPLSVSSRGARLDVASLRLPDSVTTLRLTVHARNIDGSDLGPVEGAVAEATRRSGGSLPAELVAPLPASGVEGQTLVAFVEAFGRVRVATLEPTDGSASFALPAEELDARADGETGAASSLDAGTRPAIRAATAARS